jgi:hypothetical protein
MARRFLLYLTLLWCLCASVQSVTTNQEIMDTFHALCSPPSCMLFYFVNQVIFHIGFKSCSCSNLNQSQVLNLPAGLVSMRLDDCPKHTFPYRNLRLQTPSVLQRFFMSEAGHLDESDLVFLEQTTQLGSIDIQNSTFSSLQLTICITATNVDIFTCRRPGVDSTRPLVNLGLMSTTESIVFQSEYSHIQRCCFPSIPSKHSIAINDP